MPAVQTTYPATQAPAYLGMLANGEQVTNVISRVVDPASSTPVRFGDPVVQGASEQLVLSATGTSGVFRGIAVRNTTLPPANGDQYVAGNTAAILTKGVIWVTAAVAVNPGQPAYVTTAGSLTNIATANTAIPNAMWESQTTGAAGLAKLRLA